MDLKRFEGSVRNIKEDSSVERIEVTTIPVTKGQALTIGQALLDLKDVSMDLTKNEVGKQILKFEIISDNSLAN